MDIVSLKPGGKGRNRRGSERRHTTEVRFEQLPSHHTLSQLERDSITSLSNEDLSPRGNGLSQPGDALSPRGNAYHHPVAQMPYHQGPRGGVKESSLVANGHSLSSSWGPQPPNNNPLRAAGANRDRSASAQYFKGSQVNMLGDEEFSDVPGEGGAMGVAGHQYQLSYELALDNVLTPFANHAPISSLALAKVSSNKRPKLSDNPVMEEVIATEMTYVRDVQDIIEGYLLPLQKHVQFLPISAHQISSLFGNIEDIWEFHKSLLEKFVECKGSVGKLGESFLHRVEDFKELYTLYCTNYPNSVQVLSELFKVVEVADKLKSCQQELHHMLPLGAYLLKPVQRILRYHLLLSHMKKKTSPEAEGFSLVEDAVEKMTEVAEHINSMKKKYDTAIHVQEIQNLIRGHEMQTLDLTKYGDLVLEDSFRYSSGRNASSAFRGRADRYVFLFQKLFFVTKKEEDGGFQYKMHVQMKDLQLTERVEKEPSCFQIRQVSTGRAYTFQARHEAAKEEWVRKVKLLLVESIPDLPDKARLLIMGGFEVHSDSSPLRDRRADGSRHVDSDIGGVVRKTQSLGRHATPQMMHLHNSPPLSKGTRNRHQTSPVPIRLLDSSLVSSVHDATFTRNESPSTGSKKSHSHTHTTTEVISEVKYQIGATYSPKSRSFNHHHVPSSEDDVSTDISTDSSTSSLDGKETTPTFHANGGGDHHKHHFSSPPDITSPENNLPPVPTLFGQTHSAVCESVRKDGESDIGTDDLEHEITPPPGFGEGDDETPPRDPTNRKTPNENHHSSGTGASPQDEGETLFNEIMYSMPANSIMDRRLSCMNKKESSTNLDWGQSGSRSSSVSKDDYTVKTTPPDEHAIDHNRMDSSNTISDRISRSSSMDEGSTPKASPYTSPSSIRRWSVKKRRSYDQNDPDEVTTTTKTSPYIRRHHSASVRSMSASSTGSDNVFPLPILDPPTPFRNPIKVEHLGPFPDENLESSVSNHDQGDSDSKRSSTISVEEMSGTNYSSEVIHVSEDRPPHITPPPDVLFRTSDIATLALSESVPAAKSPKKSKKSPVKRSHSFGSNKRITILHQRDGSLSTNNSPLPTHKFTPEKPKESSVTSFVAKVRHRRHSKGSPAPATPNSRGNDIAGTPTEVPSIFVDADDLASSSGADSTHSLILPPPAEFKSAEEPGSSNRFSIGSREDEEIEVEKEEKSRFSFFRLKHHNSNKHGSRSATPSDLTREDKRADFTISMPIPPSIVTSVATPRDDDDYNKDLPMRSASSNDMISFDEALETCDQYATQTGKTANSAKQAKNVREALSAAQAGFLFPPSPSPTGEEPSKKEGKKKDKKKKKKRHGYTVANIDSDTMKAVQQNLASREQARKASDSRVHQLAREYSQKIKDRSKTHKKYSTVFEDDEADAIFQDSSKPEWLAQLGMKKRQSSTGNILDVRATEDDDCSSTGSGVDAIEPTLLQHRMGTEEEAVAGAVGRTSQHQRHTLGHMHNHRAWVEEEAKTGKLKGWVRSLAAKFAKKEGTTL